VIVSEEFFPDNGLGNRVGEQADAVDDQRAVALHGARIIAEKCTSQNAECKTRKKSNLPVFFSLCILHASFCIYSEFDA
jgi:hypothetical protein